MKFVNRTEELKELTKWGTAGTMLVLYGRRRVGKTSLLTHWIHGKEFGYSQAIEGARQLQIDQVMADLGNLVKTELRPTNWNQFFELLESIESRVSICLDEFPYLVTSDPSLPSILQKWWDHRKRKNITLILCGSSQKMMHSIFLNQSSALYGRAHRILKIEPMNYQSFCKACDLDFKDINSYLKYSLVGGIPKYWEYVDSKSTVLELARVLYFQSGSIMEREPNRVLSDEKVEGLVPLSVLEAIGRGAHRPSEIGTRLEAKQTSLSKIFAQLIDASLIEREIPFGNSPKNSKISLYKIYDPVLRFWYSVYSSYRTRWFQLTDSAKKKLIHDHASQIFEIEVRKTIDGHRYWNSKVELDAIVLNSDGSLTACEVKFKSLSDKEKDSIAAQVREKIDKTELHFQHENIKVAVIGWKDFIKRL